MLTDLFVQIRETGGDVEKFGGFGWFGEMRMETGGQNFQPFGRAGLRGKSDGRNFSCLVLIEKAQFFDEGKTVFVRHFDVADD